MVNTGSACQLSVIGSVIGSLGWLLGPATGPVWLNNNTIGSFRLGWVSLACLPGSGSGWPGSGLGQSGLAWVIVRPATCHWAVRLGQ